VSRKKARRRERGAATSATGADVRGRPAPAEKVVRTRGTPGVVRDPSMFLAPLAVAVVTAIAYANISADVLIHDDRFFYPSPSPLDGSRAARTRGARSCRTAADRPIPPSAGSRTRLWPIAAPSTPGS